MNAKAVRALDLVQGLARRVTGGFFERLRQAARRHARSRREPDGHVANRERVERSVGRGYDNADDYFHALRLHPVRPGNQVRPLPVFGARGASGGGPLRVAPCVDTGTLDLWCRCSPGHPLIAAAWVRVRAAFGDRMGSCVLRETIRNVVRGLLRAFLYVLLTRRRGANAAHTQMGRPTHCLPTRYLRKYRHTNTRPMS